MISRTLIQQQIRQEDEQADEPSQTEVDARLKEIRNEIPACVRQNCASDAGWKAFLAAHELTPERVEAYLRYRLEILRFIEQRFRPGHPHLAAGDRNLLSRDAAAAIRARRSDSLPRHVSSRIQEILLQQQVNVLFDEWLTNLRKQGEVEVLDPSLEPPTPQRSAIQPPGAVGNAIEPKGSQ